jgi:peptidoglycan/xylan/chitin deacetylase (PgdA/CDA1 family)
MPKSTRVLLATLTAVGLSAGVLPLASAAPLLEPTRAAATRAAAPAAGTHGVSVHFRVGTSKPVFFITIDDGWTKQQAAADYVKAHHLPVTVFLTNAAVGGRWAFFKKMAAFDSVQNHTMTHKALTGVSSSTRQFEICRTQSIYAKNIGTRPWMLRPPYGVGYMPRRASTPLLESTAGSCGIKHVVLWNVTVSQSGKVEFAGVPFRRGDIVLLHFVGDIKANLAKIVRLYAQHGLHPAPLSQYLTR